MEGHQLQRRAEGVAATMFHPRALLSLLCALLAVRSSAVLHAAELAAALGAARCACSAVAGDSGSKPATLGLHCAPPSVSAA